MIHFEIVSNCGLTLYLNVGEIWEGSRKTFQEKSWNFLSIKAWECCQVRSEG